MVGTTLRAAVLAALVGALTACQTVPHTVSDDAVLSRAATLSPEQLPVRMDNWQEIDNWRRNEVKQVYLLEEDTSLLGGTWEGMWRCWLCKTYWMRGTSDKIIELASAPDGMRGSSSLRIDVEDNQTVAVTRINRFPRHPSQIAHLRRHGVHAEEVRTARNQYHGRIFKGKLRIPDRFSIRLLRDAEGALYLYVYTHTKTFRHPIVYVWRKVRPPASPTTASR